MIRRQDESLCEQIDDVFDTLFDVLFFKKKLSENEFDSFRWSDSQLELKTSLMKYLKNFEFSKAKEKLDDAINKDEKNLHCSLHVAVWFYFKLNSFDDEILYKHDISRQDILYELKSIDYRLFSSF